MKNGNETEPEPVITLIRRHLDRYPESSFHDVYKLLHQAAFGPGHLVDNKKKALEWIERDLDEPGPTAIPLAESIHPAGDIVRLHLRPYAAQRGNLRRLRDAFVASAEAVTGAPDLMATWWAAFCDWVEAENPARAGFDLREMRLFGGMWGAKQWPAEHHSPAYRSAYRPAYRVLAAPIAADLCRAQGIVFEPI
ncbi:MAG: hypothetical protein JXB47_11670 [Anaerolineae bacterium]|nr:hypothetical protein [Anaerolineae bacterium]